ncbi:cyclin-dependent kinase 11B-like isoform X2 [Ruditapes philippinarum]|uniref:cyclin-dependent kinase 11B-like isoform X2 n=1 Tax=Ruditapes philippinarum TaxID=129788 RepID=UPI00295C1A49|nr:cyclin-dependent kinase 11B-like isoform X2 [Ruditapes philippinarum]
MSRRKVTLVSDRSSRSPYEQGELASSSPELAARSEDNETSEHEVEEEEEEEEHTQSDRDHDMHSADEEDHDDGPGIKPPPVPVKKKDKHKHKHKEDRKKEKQRERHREEKEGHRGKERSHGRDIRDHREDRGAPRGNQERHDRKLLTGREREKELKEKLIKEKEKREKSRMERERLERLEREKNRDRKLREERDRREQERRKKKEEERKLQQQRKEREEIRIRKEQRMIKEKGIIRHRSRSRSRERRESSRDHSKSRHAHRSSDKGSRSGSKSHEDHERSKERKVQVKKEVRESEEEHVEEKHELPDTALSPSEEESEDTESDSGSGSESSSESDDSSEEEDHVKDGSVKIKSESPDHDDPDKKHLAKSKFDDHSENESETHSVHLNDHHEDDGYLDETPPMSPLELKPDLPPYFPAIQGCRNVEEFSCLNRIEEGTYGVVYRARDKKTDEIVALKRLKMEKEKEGFPITSLREINTLLKAQHTNIVTVREIVVGSNMDKIYIVMDYVEHDLKSLMAPETMKQPFLVGEVKTLMLQLLRGVHHLHDNWIIHRDLKTSNLLLSHKGILKIGDFGLAREYGEPLKHYTPIVVTLWYRSPELLLGIKEYSTPIDMWSVGCIMAEFLVMKAIWQGKSEIDQLQKIFKDLGTPTEKIWPGVMELSGMKKCSFTEYPYNTLRNKFGQYLSDQGFNLLNRFLTYNPTKRITAGEALKHEYFRESPVPIDPSMFPTWPAKSEQVRKHASSPKPPSGGKAYSKLLDDGDDAIAAGFQFRQAAKGVSAIGPGFSLKF